ncbi:MAG: hypothetical protein BWZ10_00853 [candidate division BRC1 bacterium ADurb.BinA364]|nr:MAG: hypothetical protein BWZ10_00853 [candidate division BRC1 bacterium ADurb.BinA364]
MRYIRIAILKNEVEAALLESILRERGIAHDVFSYRDSAFDGLFQPQKGWGHVEAPEDDREEILEILADLRKDEGGNEEHD